MASYWKHIRGLTAYRTKLLINAAAGQIAARLLAVLHRFDRVKVSNLAAAAMRTIGPFLREHRIGRANLKAAFPEKSDAEIETILRGVWDNLGRVAAEIAHLDHIYAGDASRASYIDYTQKNIDRFLLLRDDEKPALVFTAHLANWELPPVVATCHGLSSTVLYRRPNIGAVADAVIALRQGVMGELVPSNLAAPLALARALEKGQHVGMLVDQHYGKGVEVVFFGRKCLANPLIAMLAREAECPIYGVRLIRRPGHRFEGEISDEVVSVRDTQGRVDIRGTMQAITRVVEGWVREYPEQWLWVHRRWR